MAASDGGPCTSPPSTEGDRCRSWRVRRRCGALPRAGWPTTCGGSGRELLAGSTAAPASPTDSASSSTRGTSCVAMRSRSRASRRPRRRASRAMLGEPSPEHPVPGQRGRRSAGRRRVDAGARGSRPAGRAGIGSGSGRRRGEPVESESSEGVAPLVRVPRCQSDERGSLRKVAATIKMPGRSNSRDALPGASLSECPHPT